MTRVSTLLQSPVPFARAATSEAPRAPIGQPFIVVLGGPGIDLTTLLDTAVAAGTNFGSAPIGGAEIRRTFTIANVGSAALWISGVGIEGTDADQFRVVTHPEPLASAGFSTTFSVGFQARREGPAFALVLISTNDPEECPYMFLVEGCGEVA